MTETDEENRSRIIRINDDQWLEFNGIDILYLMEKTPEGNVAIGKIDLTMKAIEAFSGFSFNGWIPNRDGTKFEEGDYCENCGELFLKDGNPLCERCREIKKNKKS